MTKDQGSERARRLGELCTGKGLKLAVAESMTGGALSDLICSISGASRYFLGGLVCYAPETKSFVGVSGEDIQSFGIYSEEVAIGLAEGSMSRFGGDVGIGITGIAEPDDEKSVPGAWVAVAFQGGIVARNVLCTEGTGRNEARRTVAVEALGLVLEIIGRRE